MGKPLSHSKGLLLPVAGKYITHPIKPRNFEHNPTKIKLLIPIGFHRIVQHVLKSLLKNAISKCFTLNGSCPLSTSKHFFLNVYIAQNIHILKNHDDRILFYVPAKPGIYHCGF